MDQWCALLIWIQQYPGPALVLGLLLGLSLMMLIGALVGNTARQPSASAYTSRFQAVGARADELRRGRSAKYVRDVKDTLGRR